MKLKKRLILSNTITIIIPFAITIFLSLIFILFSATFLGREVNYDGVKALAKVRLELFDTAGSILLQKPETIEDQGFQHYLAERLTEIKGQVIVVKADNIVFATMNINKIDVEKSLEKSKALNSIVKINNSSYFVEAIPMDFSDNTKGHVIMLAPYGKEMRFVEGFLLGVPLIFIISFIAVNAIMAYLFTKRMLRPVEQLKAAATEISSGNLDCEIAEEGDEEIKELCRDFEAMRIQLKDSIRLQMLYDDNRKMLLSSISHDLKTPITSIKGYVEGILDGVANTPDKLQEYLTTIYSKTEQVDEMIDDLLLYSKLDLKQIPYNFERTDILNYFKDCVSESINELTKANIKIELINNIQISRQVLLDRMRMKRVIVNIIDNCRKYMDKEQGRLTISLRDTESSIIIEMRDNGRGIDKKDAKKIFDRFYRADTARTGTEGSGLGLAIAKQIVEGHGGRIWAVSHGDKGTSIIISLGRIKVE
jgi:signal transduction histidine kinase